ncbi:hypothetical protein JCM11491_006784 [Sporobolomyces phaffii]
MSLAPDAVPEFLSSLASAARYSIRDTDVGTALNAFALDPTSPYHALFGPVGVDAPAQLSPSPSSRPCGHVFKPGESVYRCRTCGLDSTCVLCSTCFHASPEHRDDRHDVTVSTHSGVGAGCCDCGDPEAWKPHRQERCKLHGVHTTTKGKGKERQSDHDRHLDELNDALRRDVADLVRSVLDWSLERFERSPQDVVAPTSVHDFAVPPSGPPPPAPAPPPPASSTTVGAPRLQSATIPSSSSVSPPVAAARSRGPFAVVLWNDEKHSFPQVIDIVSRATGCSRAAAAQVAQRVDTVGRDVVLVTPTATEALRVASTIHSIDLGVDVRDAHHAFDEAVAGEVVKWIKDLLHVRVAQEANALRDVVAEVWTERDRDRGGESRFMRFARVEERLWKEVRKNVQEICVGLMSVTPELKARLSIQYASIYPHLCNSYLLTDREPEHSLIFLSVQIFTVPSICLTLVSPPYNFLTTVLDILFAFFTEQTDPPRPPPLPSPLEDSLSAAAAAAAAARPKPRRLVLPPNPHVRSVDPESGASFKQKRYFQLFSDLGHLVSSRGVQDFVVATPNVLDHVVAFLALFEGMNPVVRAVGTHVEYESDSWVSAFNVTIQLGKLCRAFGDAFRVAAGPDPAPLAGALQTVLAKMHDTDDGSSRNLHTVRLGGAGGGREYGSVAFDVSTSKNSFHHPLAWLWAEMAKNVQRLDPERLRDACRDERGSVESFLIAMERPLRVVVLVAQVRAGLWVRNGFGIRAQQLHYKEYSLRENTYDQDVFFLQNALVVLGASAVFAAIVDRFDLAAWLIDGRDDHAVFEPIQAMAMTEELLSLVIALVSDPTWIAPLSDAAALRRELVHYLALGPCVYSDLLRRVSERFADDPALDGVLASVAHFKPPLGTNDQGTYALRAECYAEVDPYFSRYTRNQREEVDKVVRAELGKQRGRDGDVVVIVPRPLEVTCGPFVDLARDALASPVLVQVVFFALKHGQRRGDLFSEVVVDQALHLAMLALVDPASRAGFVAFARAPAPVEPDSDAEAGDEEREADEYVPKAGDSSKRVVVEEDEATFVRLLVKLADDERMKAVRHKAGWILDELEATLGDEVGRWRRARASVESEAEALEQKNAEKRLAAKKRQEAIMQQFAKAQSAFLESVEDEDDDDDDDDTFDDDEDDARRRGADEVDMGDDDDDATSPKPKIDFGSCIVCQDELEGSKAFGILGLVQGSNLIRLTPSGPDNVAFQHEILATPASLDRDASSVRPFGIASEKTRVHSFDDSGDGIARGFPQNQKSGFHASSCGHLMHLACFETYCASLATRHRQQPTRCHPETIERREFVCPLCKSLGNVLLPATSDAPAFHPHRGPLDSRSLAAWADPGASPVASSRSDEGQAAPLDEQTLARVDRLQVVNDLDQSVLFKPWRISLALPTVLLEHFGDREGLMIARLLQVVTALKSEVSGPSGRAATTLTEDLIGYTLASIEVAARGTADPAWKIGDSSLRLVQSLFSTMQHVIEAMSPSLDDSRQVAGIAIRQRLGGLFARGTKFEHVEFTRFDPLGSVIESAACTPSMFYHVVAVSFYTCLAQALVGVFRLFHRSATLAEWRGDLESSEARLCVSLAQVRTFFDSPALFDPKSAAFDVTLGKHLYAQVLPFLRRSAIVARVVFGEPCASDDDQAADSERTELERLLALLRIPHPAQVLSPPMIDADSTDSDPFPSSSSSASVLRAHLAECARSAASFLHGFDPASTVDKLVHSSAVPDVEHPAIYELLGLADHLDTLAASVLDRACARCREPPENPAVCLLCGELVCCQSFCCMAGEDEAQHGECNEHMWTCGGSIGVYFLVKRNVILYLHTDKGTFTPPPYLDSHGEVDNGRTRTRSVFPQYLHRGRYDEVRKVWLTQGVPTLVARKLDATTDHGGWTTM